MNKRLIIWSSFMAFFLFGNASYAITVYGESNAEAAVKYDGSANAAEYSVVSVNGGSAVYLGNGWFVTASHVNVSTLQSIRQNGVSGSISYVDNSIKSSTGADMSLFYVEDLSNFDYLTSVNISAEPFSSLTDTTYGVSGSSSSGYTLVGHEGSLLLLAGAGFGRSESSGLTDMTVASNGVSGTVRSGEAALFQSAAISGYDYLVTLAEAENGRAQAQNYDSGSGMFLEFNGEWYLMGLTVAVSPASSQTSVTFASYMDGELVYDADGNPVGVDLSALADASKTLALNLYAYIDDINAIIAVNPIPEPAHVALVFALGALLLCAARKKFL